MIHEEAMETDWMFIQGWYYHVRVVMWSTLIRLNINLNFWKSIRIDYRIT